MNDFNSDERLTSSLATIDGTEAIGAIELVPSLESLAGDWNRLAGASPFLSYEWLSAWWRHYGDEQDLFTVAVRNSNGELVAIAPWRLEHSPTQGREIRFLGDGVVCSDYLSLLCRADYAVSAPAALAEWLSGPAAPLWDAIEWSGVATDDPIMRRLTAALTDAGHTQSTEADAQCWRVALPADWDTFLAGLSASRRQKTRALLRQNLDNQRMDLRRVTNREELARAFEWLVDLHTRRRRSLGQDGCFASAQFTDFLREAAERLLIANRLRMFWLEFDSRPIAVELGLIADDAVYYYQGGFDPAAAEARPGWLAFAGSLRAAIGEGYRVYDFLRGDELYKASWGARPRQLVTVRIAGQNVLAQLRHAAWRTQLTIKRLVRAWKPVALPVVDRLTTPFPNVVTSGH
jgi:CelD/BcsL family acetyltransferase involved in cellulose biosynthesis